MAEYIIDIGDSAEQYKKIFKTEEAKTFFGHRIKSDAIVRCKDCDYYIKEQGLCDVNGGRWNENDFCSCGIRIPNNSHIYYNDNNDNFYKVLLNQNYKNINFLDPKFKYYITFKDKTITLSLQEIFDILCYAKKFSQALKEEENE